MNQISIRFYAELNDFLPIERRNIRFYYATPNQPSIKDVIEAIGIPHAEVDLILVNEKSVNFSYQVKDKDDISVYPIFEALDISDVSHLRPKPLRQIKFILDVHLGKLNRYLRLLGFDCIYRNDYADAEIVAISMAEHRIILTRDINLLKHKQITHGYWVRNTDPKQQVNEIIKRFHLHKQITPFKRCIVCNGLIKPIAKNAIEHELLPATKKYYQVFYHCVDCKKIYWKGSHYDNMLKLLRTYGDRV